MDDGSQLLKALNVLMLKILVRFYLLFCFVSSALLFPTFAVHFCHFLLSFHWLFNVQDNADRTSSFVVLIKLLRPLDPSRWPAPSSNETFAVRNQKFSDLVVKCLIKLTKVNCYLSSFFFLLSLQSKDFGRGFSNAYGSWRRG